jgi:lambda repressor-like predicted transcriptional regulator
MQPITESKKPRNWTRRKINAELKAVGLRQSDLVRRTGKSQPMVSEVVAGRRKSQPIAVEIAAALGLQPHEIWPRLYAPPSAEPMTEPTAAPDQGLTPIATAC